VSSGTLNLAQPTKAYTVLQKSIPDIIDCSLKKDYHILIIFGADILDTTGRETTAHVPTSPNVCLCTTLGKPNKRNNTFLFKAVWLLY